ncbi:gamma-glutamylaminecyclotransferase B [Salarias fasciatus]|nr:gamma-glutamylaminecyclotransferase [Salarias fasciatus]
MTLLFVYGTLKRGQPNHHRLLDPAHGSAVFVAPALTVQRFPLIIATEYNIPFLLNLPGDGNRIHGELYRIDASMLEFLDDFEGVPARYQRHPVELEVTGAGSEGLKVGGRMEAFIYTTTTFKPEWPALQRFESYDADGDHGLKYCYPEDRH